MNEELQKYSKMQKDYYESRQITPEQVVGNYAWHEEFPYETQLLYKNGDLRHPLMENLSEKRALDFGCGPGRMVKRMSKIFKEVDGVDISSNLLEEAKKLCPSSSFYVSAGDDLGKAPSGHYDFAYSTIALQHIAVHDIRMKIFKEIYRSLKPGGAMTVQMAFNPDFPFIRKRKEFDTKDFKLKLFQRLTSHARWSENRTDAASTNSGCDVAIGQEDLAQVRTDFESIFKDVSFWFYDVRLIFPNLNGKQHAGKYWPTHWIFIHGKK